MRYRGITKGQNESKIKNTIKAQIAVCVVLLVALSIIKLTPDDTLTKTKNAVKFILNQQTNLREEADKIKGIFTQDEGISAMNPVSEFVNPAPEGTVVVGFGAQDAQNSDFHYGVDIKLPEGQNVVAAASGEVTEIATSEEYGSYIIIAHNNEIFTMYAHLNEILPDVGEKVEAAKPIARANAQNNTIYFEIRRGDTYLNPADFIDFGEHNG